MFLVSLKACNNLFSLNRKTTQKPLNKTQMTTDCRERTGTGDVGLLGD